MRSLHEFIVHIPKDFKDSYKTESGLEIFADKRWSQRQLATTVVKVIKTPMSYEGEIEVGDFLFIDNAAVMRQEHIKTGVHESHHLIDRDKRLYSIPKMLLIAYKKKNTKEWIGFGDNVIIEREMVKEEKKSSLLVSPTENIKKESKGKGVLFIVNNQIIDTGANKGDQIYFNELGAIDMFLGDKKVTWLKNRQVLAKIN